MYKNCTPPSSAKLWNILVLSRPLWILVDWDGPGVTLKMCHWISMWASAFSLLPSPTYTLRAASHVQDSRQSRVHGAVFITSFFRMKNVKILHLLLFLVFLHACFGKFHFLMLCLQCCCDEIMFAIQIQLRASGLIVNFFRFMIEVYSSSKSLSCLICCPYRCTSVYTLSDYLTAKKMFVWIWFQR